MSAEHIGKVIEALATAGGGTIAVAIFNLVLKPWSEREATRLNERRLAMDKAEIDRKAAAEEREERRRELAEARNRAEAAEERERASEARERALQAEIADIHKRYRESTEKRTR